MSNNKPSERIEFHAYDINLKECYSELLKTLELIPYSRQGISKEEYLSRIKGGIESYCQFHKLGSLDSVMPIILNYPAYNYYAHLAFQLMTFDINKISAILDYQHEQYVGMIEFPKMVEHGVYDWIKNNSPFDNNTRLQNILNWVEKRKGVLHKKNKIALKIGDAILEKFKKANCDVGHIIMMRNVDFMYSGLNPIEKKLFNTVLNSMIIEGFIDYDDREPNFLRLGEKGFKRIYEEHEEELPYEANDENDVLPKIVILTAIKEEYVAVRAHLNEIVDLKKDSVIYEQGIFFHNGKKIAKVFIKECGPKNPISAQETQRALTNFHPQCILFVGIAGSKKPHDFKLGDVIFPEKVHYYEGGKSELAGFKPRSDDVRPTFALYEIAKLERHKDDWKKLIKTNLTTKVSADIGIIASGEKVVEHYDSEAGKMISTYYGDSSCIEMEGYGFLNTISRQGGEFATLFAGVVRGISDILEQGEQEPVQNTANVERRPLDAKRIASDTAAAFAYWLVIKIFEKK